MFVSVAHNYQKTDLLNVAWLDWGNKIKPTKKTPDKRKWMNEWICNDCIWKKNKAA